MPLPKAHADRVRLIDTAISAQTAKAAFEVLIPSSAAFGQAWKNARSDWGALEAILEWRSAHADLPSTTWRVLAAIDSLPAMETARIELTRLLPDFEQRLSALILELDLDMNRALASQTWRTCRSRSCLSD
jgi:hypothetical protein